MFGAVTETRGVHGSQRTGAIVDIYEAEESAEVGLVSLSLCDYPHGRAVGAGAPVTSRRTRSQNAWTFALTGSASIPRTL